MPDQALAWLAGEHPLDDQVGRVVLLVAADDLDPALLAVGGEQREVGEDVEDDRRPQEALHRRLHADERAQSGLVVAAPGAPQLDRSANRAIHQLLALGGDAEDVGDEQLGDVDLVVVVELGRGVEPAHRLANRGLGLDDDQRETVDQEDEVGTALGPACPEDELVGDDVVVVRLILEVDQADARVLVVGAERHRAVAAQPGGHLLVGLEQPVGAHREDNGA
mgnify:CR=1 FL=1